MKKMIGIAIALLAVFAMQASAGTREVVYSFPGSSSTTGTAVQAKSYNVYGSVESIYIDVTGLTTGTVAVTSYDSNDAVTQTIYSKALITADAVAYPRHGVQAFDGVSTNMTTVLDKFPVAGKVTVTFTGQAASTSTNDVDVTLLISD